MPPRDSKLRAYLELLRLPNVFTAVADVVMGACFVTLSPWRTQLPAFRPGILLLLVAASCCLYLAGMVLNDYFDRNKDALERPARPIPSRRVPESAAQWLGSELLIVGVALSWLVSYLVGDFRSGLVGLLLAAAVVLYDGILKRSWLGPIGMGACRTLNVLLGMSATAAAWSTANYVVAGGIGLYIVGVTWFARTEAQLSSRANLAASSIVILLGMATLAVYPNFSEAKTYVDHKLELWYFFWALLALQIGWRCLRAVFEPVPANVQRLVKHCLLSLIVLDAAVTFTVQGQWVGAAMLLLLVPTMLLGRWIPST